MENIPEASAQRDSRRGDAFETPASESDSGDSLFFTQSVSSPSRTVKRHRPSFTPACPLSQQSEDEQEREPNPNPQHKGARPRSDSDSETNYDDLLRKWRSLENTRRRVNRRPRQRSRRAAPKRLWLPFLSSFGQVPARRSQTIVNSEIGGFLKCVLKLSKGSGEKGRRKLSPSVLSADSEENNMEENEDDEDIRKVNPDCFIQNTHTRNRQPWLPSLKWKKKDASRKCTEKSNKHQEDKKKCYRTRKVAKDLMAPQDDTDIHNENESLNIEVTPSRKRGKKTRKSSARTSLSPCSSHSRLSPDKSLFIRSLFLDHQEEHSEPQVLVACSQSQFLEAQEIYQTFENWQEPITEVSVEETDHEDDDETQILDENLRDQNRGGSTHCSENISFQEHHNQVENVNPGVYHEPEKNEDLGSIGVGFTSSQDLFQEPDNQPSPLRKNCDKNSNEENLESNVLIQDSNIKKQKRPSLILSNVESTNVKNSNFQKGQSSETSSPTLRGIHKERKEKDKKTSDHSIEHSYPSLPLEDNVSGSRRNDFSSPNKDVLMVGREEKTETPLFIYGGMTFLKRKKGKKTKAPEVSDNPPPIQVDLGKNEGSVLQVNDIECKKRKKMKNDGLLEESVATMKENSVPLDPSLSPQDCSVDCASGNVNKPKKKDKNGGLLEEVVNPMPEISISAESSLSVQETLVVCSFGGSKPKKKRKKEKYGQPVPQVDQSVDVEEPVQVPCQHSASLLSIVAEPEQMISTDLSSPSFSHNVNQVDNNTPLKDLVESDGHETRRKKKKKKMDGKWKSPLTSDQMTVQQSSQESHSSLGADTVKKKKKKFIHDVYQLKDMAMASYNHGEPLEKISEIPAGIEIQTVGSIGLKKDDFVTPIKKKKRKQEQVVREDNVDYEASLVKTTEDMEILDTIQDSEQQAAELVLTSKAKKRKKKKERTETTQEEEASKNSCLSLGHGDVATPNTSTRSEAGEIVEADVPGAEPIKKKKKKKRKKELKNDASLSVCHDLEYLHQSPYHNTVENEASGSGDKENPSTCLETHSTNDSNKKKKREGTKGDGSKRSQQVLRSEDSIQPKKKKKKKKRELVETDREVDPEVVEHDFWQESGSPSEPSEAINEKKKKKKKKKNRSDKVGGESESLDVAPEDPKDVFITCYDTEDNISFSAVELSGHVKKKKKVRDLINDLETMSGDKQVAVSDKLNSCLQTHSKKLKKKKDRLL
ncbi:uncharacterized protein LOC128512502 [Clarias gariepinus]|uniref:uncharacterized protein LOC128512502 n=1 Tax=Clarias gariepinus TaxID=13013 RepID=UPI00234C9D63|nr:uncharacterized protein LOC128512502 [Clarias gariepinus]